MFDFFWAVVTPAAAAVVVLAICYCGSSLAIHNSTKKKRKGERSCQLWTSVQRQKLQQQQKTLSATSSWSSSTMWDPKEETAVHHHLTMVSIRLSIDHISPAIQADQATFGHLIIVIHIHIHRPIEPFILRWHANSWAFAIHFFPSLN